MDEWAKRLAKAALPNPLYQRLKTVYLVRSFESRVVEHDYGGLRLRMNVEDPVAAQWYSYDWPEPAEVTILRQQGLSGARVFDLGAHQGLVAMMLAHLVGDAGRVIAVEAGRHNVRVCRRNLALNDIQNVDVVWAAVGDSTGEVSFPESFCGSIVPKAGWVKATIPAVTIDELAHRYGAPDAVMLDIEGAEMLALRGGAQSIARGALFVVEIHAGCGLEEMGADASDVLDAFPSYRLLISPGHASSEWQSPAGPITQRTFLFASPQ